MRFVIDASVAGAWVLPDEQSDIARAIRLGYEHNVSTVPAHWWMEVRNLLLMAERKGRIDSSRSERALALFARLPMEMDDAPDEPLLMDVARRHQLTAYDAAYLELALRTGSPLATLDRPLAKAAKAEDVTVVE